MVVRFIDVSLKYCPNMAFIAVDLPDDTCPHNAILTLYVDRTGLIHSALDFLPILFVDLLILLPLNAMFKCNKIINFFKLIFNCKKIDYFSH